MVHLYAPLEGLRAATAYHALRDLWLACRYLFAMDAAVAGTGLPRDLPAAAAEPPVTHRDPGESALAAQGDDDRDCQAGLRRHHDVLVLSVALAPRTGTAPGWRRLDGQWDALTVGRLGPFLGETRIRLGLVPGPLAPGGAADAGLTARLAGALPPMTGGRLRPEDGVVVRDRLAVWETTPGEDTRVRRDLVVATTADGDDEASAWLWSTDGIAIPPLARYLLHAAKLGHQLRVWTRDSPRVAEVRAALDASTVPGGPGTTREARRAAFDARIMITRLRDLRRTVDIAADNMERSLHGGPPAHGFFRDDRDLARWFLSRLDDETGYLEAAPERAEHVLAARTEPERPAPAPSPDIAPAVPAAGPVSSADTRRTVFVVHGRDEQVRAGMFDFLRAIDLRPLEWENVVEPTGTISPYLGEVIAQGIARAQAVVVLLPPDDVVRLHPSLCVPSDGREEREPGMQARPNVLLELGMALGVAPERTLIVKVGAHRAVADLGGRNFIQLSDTAACRRKIAQRLRVAGCPVDDRGQDWLTAGRFTGLTADTRHPAG
ncbi:CATRA conflict system CASPASE/TPR repeat-associated protein [Streptomyces specialis]|uniref:CATRA conflict system CASPASE/TPR repeat-associated protein n=1 Tax=Streptomyces specialis TaxID=498367 RepID=UPI00073F0093|nr:CATRA conflict system CASPASE/TPR repeat-associated protein [Streptomyces specialis]